MIANAGPTPNAPMARPAAAGPITRAPLNIAELRATALPTSSRPTSSKANDCRTGMSTAFAIPSRNASRRIIQTSTMPPMTRTDRTAARIIIVTCVQIRTRRFGSASAATPANSPRTMTGMNCAAATTPSQIGSWVSSRTSHAWATCCIQVPTSEIAWPEKNSR